MKLPSHSFQGEWAPFNNEGVELRAEEYIDLAHSRNRAHPSRTVYIMGPDDAKLVREDPVAPDVTYVRYFSGDKGSVLLGLNIASSMRGHGLGAQVLGYTRTQLHEKKRPLNATCNIHKPVLALVLKRAGFEPVSDDYIVEVLPSDLQSEDQAAPNVRLLRKRVLPTTIKTGSKHGHFYNILENWQIGRAQIDYGRAVRLHTPYIKRV